MSDKFHSDLRQRFGERVPFAAEYIEVPAAIEPVIIEFFDRLADFDANLRIQRIWIDAEGKLHIAVSGRRTGLDDIIAAAEDAAAQTLGDSND